MVILLCSADTPLQSWHMMSALTNSYTPSDPQTHHPQCIWQLSVNSKSTNRGSIISNLNLANLWVCVYLSCHVASPLCCHWSQSIFHSLTDSAVLASSLFHGERKVTEGIRWRLGGSAAGRKSGLHTAHGHTTFILITFFISFLLWPIITVLRILVTSIPSCFWLLKLAFQCPNLPWRSWWRTWWPVSRCQGPPWMFTWTTPIGVQPIRGSGARFYSRWRTVQASVSRCWAKWKATCPAPCRGAPPRGQVSRITTRKRFRWRYYTSTVQKSTKIR